jgi:hypothetical protein
MKHKAQHSTPQLRKLQLKGQDVFPVFGRPVGMVNLRHSPRTKFDPRPWVWGSHKDGLRYSAWELTTEKHKATEGELADLRHEVEDTNEFSHNMAHAAGVAA